MTLPRRLAVLVTVLAAFAFCACDGSANRQSTGPTITAQPPSFGAIDAKRQPPANEIPGATPGGTVTVLSGAGMQTLDPSEAYWTQTDSILSGLVTRSLTQYVYDPQRGSMVLIPDLATDVGTPNADYTEWIYTIRDGVRFEDGSKVTAEDVAYGIKRSFDRTAFHEGPAYSNYYFLHGDTYQGPYRSGTNYDGIEVDGNTLTLTMARPFPDMPYWASFPAMGPIPEHGSNPATYRLHPMATGPYKFAGNVHPNLLRLVRNDEWDPATDPGRHQYADGYRFRLHVPWKRLFTTLLRDRAAAETALTYDNVTPALYPRVQATAADRLVTGPSSCTHFLWPDYRRITDIRVRRALGYAYPHKAMIRAWGEIPGVTGQVGSSILPPETPGRRDYASLQSANGSADPAKARALLRAAGYGPGDYRISLLYQRDDPLSVRANAVLVRALQRAGFAVTSRGEADAEAWAAVYDDPNAPVNVREFEGSGWCADWPSGTSWFPPVFSSAKSNQSYFEEPAVNKEIQRIELMPLDQQPAAWGALDEAIQTRFYPAVVTFYSADAMMRGSRIGGMHNDDTLGMPTWKDLYLVR